jgi:hypothetical protein
MGMLLEILVDTRRKLVHYNRPLRLGHCEFATHARKMHKKISIDMIVNWSILVSHYPKPSGGQPQRDFYAFS